jgi:hypothetical protein
MLYVLCILTKLYRLFHFPRLLDQFKTVFPYKNKVGRLIMDTEKAHSIKHCRVDVTNYANPINCCCDGPLTGQNEGIRHGSISRDSVQIKAQALLKQ